LCLRRAESRLFAFVLMFLFEHILSSIFYITMCHETKCSIFRNFLQSKITQVIKME
jgi:hypothetical protein